MRACKNNDNRAVLSEKKHKLQSIVLSICNT